MKKLWGITWDVIGSWLPFAFAMFLSHLTLSHFARADLIRSWEPAFYSFLPMCFFFVGVVVFVSLRQIRELREAIAKLGASTK